MIDRSDLEDVHAWVDGRLGGERLRLFEERLARDDALREAAMAFRSQALALSALRREVLDEAVPPRLVRAARPWAAAPAGRFRNAGAWLVAASIAVAAWTGGWLSHARFGTVEHVAMPPTFVRDAVLAHVVFAPEVRHPVEVAAAQHEHLVQWLSRRLGAPLKVPSLEAAGWSLVGGRLLPGGEGARAQFMYEEASGARLTLYVADPGKDSGDTAFRFEADGRLAAFYWIDGRFAYTLVGQLERPALLGLAEEVYRQLASAGPALESAPQGRGQPER